MAAGLSLAGSALAGCSISAGRPQRPNGLPGAAGRAQVDVDLQFAAIAAEHRLIARCQLTLRRHPELVPRVRPVIADHAAHLHALGGSRRDVPTDLLGQVDIPAAARAAVARLASAEHAAGQDRIENCVAAQSAPFARLLASIAAAESQHSRALTGR